MPTPRVQAAAEGMPDKIRSLLIDAEGDMRKVFDLALIVHDQMEGPRGIDPQMQAALSWLTSELVELGARLNERFDAMFSAANGTPA